MRKFNDNHCEVRVKQTKTATGEATCADMSNSEFPVQPICSRLQEKALSVVFYLDMSRNIRGYQLSFYTQMITSVLQKLAAVHITNKGRNKIIIKKYSKRGQFTHHYHSEGFEYSFYSKLNLRVNLHPRLKCIT